MAESKSAIPLLRTTGISTVRTTFVAWSQVGCRNSGNHCAASRGACAGGPSRLFGIEHAALRRLGVFGMAVKFNLGEFSDQYAHTRARVMGSYPQGSKIERNKMEARPRYREAIETAVRMKGRTRWERRRIREFLRTEYAEQLAIEDVGTRRLPKRERPRCCAKTRAGHPRIAEAQRARWARWREAWACLKLRPQYAAGDRGRSLTVCSRVAEPEK